MLATSYFLFRDFLKLKLRIGLCQETHSKSPLWNYGRAPQPRRTTWPRRPNAVSRLLAKGICRFMAQSPPSPTTATLSHFENVKASYEVYLGLLLLRKTGQYMNFGELHYPR